MEINENILNNLLKPLGFRVVFSIYHNWDLLDGQNRLVRFSNYDYDNDDIYDRLIHFNESIYGSLICKDIKSIWKQITEHKYFVVVDGIVHSNPYFKCSSLEEAMIRRDLIGK